MKHPTPDYPFLAAREALQSLTGAGLAMLVVCIIGGAIPTVAAWTDLHGTEDWILLTLSWVWHWVMAGLMIWGLVALLVPVWCFYQLLHGSRGPFLVLAAALITQLLVSTVAVCTFADEEERMRPILASGTAILLTAGAAFWGRGCLRKQRDAQDVEANGGQAMNSETSRILSAASARRSPNRRAE